MLTNRGIKCPRYPVNQLFAGGRGSEPSHTKVILAYPPVSYKQKRKMKAVNRIIVSSVSTAVSTFVKLCTFTLIYNSFFYQAISPEHFIFTVCLTQWNFDFRVSKVVETNKIRPMEGLCVVTSITSGKTIFFHPILKGYCTVKFVPMNTGLFISPWNILIIRNK